MGQYKHILVATDLHDAGFPVVEHAKTLAKQSGAKLSLANVVPNVPYYMAAGLGSVSDVESQLEDESKHRLDELKKNIGSDADCHIVHGSARLEIVRMAKELDVDLIVIGSHGHQGVQRILGSTASGVLHRAHCDVLVYRIKK